MRTFAVGLLISALGALGVLWQVDQAQSNPEAAVTFVCPLGGHGDYAGLPEWENSLRNSTSH